MLRYPNYATDPHPWNVKPRSVNIRHTKRPSKETRTKILPRIGIQRWEVSDSGVISPLRVDLKPIGLGQNETSVCGRTWSYQKGFSWTQTEHVEALLRQWLILYTEIATFARKRVNTTQTRVIPGNICGKSVLSKRTHEILRVIANKGIERN